MADLADHHQPVSDLFADQRQGEPSRFRLTPEQLQQYRDDGYVAGVPILTEAQVDALRDELESFFQPEHDGRELWYEYHTNESTNPETVLFHALGAWRIAPGFHDLLWNPAFTEPAGQLVEGPVRFWHDQLFCKPPLHARRRRMAPGLFVLDAHRTDRSPNVLDRTGRQHSRQRLLALHSGQPSLESAPDHRTRGRHGRDPRRTE